jgi:hypothetical protein
MTLYVDTTAAAPDSDFYDISWCDGAIDHSDAPSTFSINSASASGPQPYTVYQVTYPTISAGSQGVATAQRLFEMVNTSTGANWGLPIVILPIDSSVDPTNPFTGMNLTGNGQCWLDTSVTPNVITVAYDIANPSNIVVYGDAASTDPITFPSNVILYHELSHAYHYATNTFAQVPASGPCTAAQYMSDEPQAEADENVFRVELGLCQRYVCNHGGGLGTGDTCGGASRPNCAGVPPAGSPDGGGGSPGSTGGCFIVSAASGSPHSLEVRLLQRIRAQIGQVSELGGRVVKGIMYEYYQFSPEIAAHIETDPAIRDAVMTTIVRPLVAWYTLTSKLGFERAGAGEVGEAVREVREVCPPSLAVHVAPFFEAIRTGGPLPESIPTQLVEHLPRVREFRKHPFLSWAIVDALVRIWTLSERGVDPVDDVAGWLSSAPVEALQPPRDAARLDAQLGAMAKFFDFRPEARLSMGERLAAAWPEATDALKCQGFTG